MTIDSPIITGSIQSPLNLTGNISASGAITGSGFFTTGNIVANTLIVQVVSSSVDYITGSAKFGTLASNTFQFTGSLFVTGGLQVSTGSVGIGMAVNAGVGLYLAAPTSANQSLSVFDFAKTRGITFYPSYTGQANTHLITSDYAGASYYNLALSARTNATDLFISSSGNAVGISTSTPNYAGLVSGISVLTIAPTSAERWGALELAGNRTAGGNQVGSLYFTNINTTNTAVALIQAINGATDVTRGDLLFYTNSGSLTEKMRIGNDGRVFIGIAGSSNGHKLEVNAGSLSSALRIDVTSGNSAISISPGGTFGIDKPGVGGGTFRIDSSGNVGINASVPTYKFQVNLGTGTAGNDVAVIGDGAGATYGNGLTIQAVDNVGFSASATCLKVGKNTSTGRSINSAGTNNASGADYAEYVTKAVTDTIAKGDVVGINSEGKLTNIFNDAISFAVKSTDPAYVGGDTWGIGLEGDALEAARATVDRVAFSGQVPCNVTGANVGDYIIPIQLENGKISGQAVTNPTFDQFKSAVGKVWKIMSDGRAWIKVIN